MCIRDSIWTNYDLSGAEADMQTEDVVISPNYLGVLTAKLAGLPLTGYMNFLDQMYAAVSYTHLQTVLLCNVQGAAELNGEHDASQLVHLTHDTGRFHTTKSFLFS